MISNAGLPVAHLGGEPAPALRAEGIVKPQRLCHIGNAVPRDGPVGNVEVDLLRPHIENILGVVGAPFRFGGAHELVGLENDVADAAPAHPGVFPAPGVDPVHHHAGHRLHSRIPFPARLALDQPRQQLPVGISHRSSSPVAFGPRFCFAGPFYADCGRQVLPLVSNKEKPERISTIKAAILLPFIQDKRMVEYYEGFLMAVDSLKRTGISIDLYAYNCGEDKASLNSILAKDEMKKMNIIFGPSQSQHTKTLAEFAKKHDIRMIIPFSSKEDEVFNNPFIYQINTPQSYLYSEVYEHFTRQFPDANVIILEAANTDKDKIEFIKGLKQELKNKGIPVKTLQETATAEMLKNALRNDKENIFIPTSDSDVTLIKIIPQLTLVKRENPEIPFHLFGYPKWQTYTKNHLDSFFELDTYFYSSFYTNNLLPAAINFIKAYHKWYSKDMVINYPQYGMLGFDTGFFFLKGLSKYGSELEKNLSNMDLTPIQTGFKFQRVNNWGGFINKKVFFVHFTKDYELVKLDFE